MKNKILIMTVIFATVGAGAVLVYLAKTGKLADLWPKTLTLSPVQPAVTNNPVVTNDNKDIEMNKETTLLKDGFTIILPPFWQEIPSQQDEADILAMAVDSREEILDEKVIKAGFRTFLSVKNDDLTRYSQEYTLEEYVDSIKVSLAQLIPSIEFSYEKQAEINGNSVIFVECKSRQEEIDYSTLLVFIKGKENLLWAISFNTLKDSWPHYRDLFYQITESFQETGS